MFWELFQKLGITHNFFNIFLSPPHIAVYVSKEDIKKVLKSTPLTAKSVIQVLQAIVHLMAVTKVLSTFLTFFAFVDTRRKAHVTQILYIRWLVGHYDMPHHCNYKDVWHENYIKMAIFYAIISIAPLDKKGHLHAY